MNQSLDIVCQPATRRGLALRWPAGGGPKREQSARFRFQQPAGDVWEWPLQVEPGDKPGSFSSPASRNSAAASGVPALVAAPGRAELD